MRVLKILVSLAILGLLVWAFDGAAIFERLRHADPAWLLAAFVALTGVTVLMARRWQIAARAFGITINFRQALGEYYLGQLVNMLLPGGVVGDVSRALRLRHQSDLAKAAQSVGMERLLGQVFMLAILGTGLALALILPGGIAWPLWGWIVPIGVLATAAICLRLARQNTATGRFLQTGTALLRQPKPIALSLTICALLFFALFACAKATGTTLPSSTWCTVLPLTLSAMIVPVSVGGWGWREGAAAALFPLFGAPAAAGIATGIAFGAVITLAALPGLYVLIQHWRIAPPLNHAPLAQDP